MSVEEIKRNSLNSLAEYKKELYENPVLKNLFIELTLKCNAKCEHCGSSCDDTSPQEEVSADEIKKALLDVSKHFNAKEIVLNITGGEPLLRKDIFDLMEYAVNLGFNWGMTSNATLINDEVIENIKRTNMGSISISLDGMKETHENFRKIPNSFDILIENVKKIQKVKTIKIIQITTVANKKNLHELEDMYELMKELKIDSWRIVNVDSIGRAKDNKELLLSNDDYKYLFSFIKKVRSEKIINVEYGCAHYLGVELEKELRNRYFICSTGLFVASILYNGDIYVCPNVERRKELVQGNIKHDSLSEVWKTKFKEFRSDDRLSCNKCTKCSDWKYCLGDSFHTWDFEKNEPSFCIKNILSEEDENDE